MKKYVSELTAITRKILVDCGVITMSVQIELSPNYRIRINEKQYFHYVITCKNSNNKYFLKVAKSGDNALHCNDYLKKFCEIERKNIYPVIITPSFLYDGVYYYVTTFIGGFTLDELQDSLDESEWTTISNGLRKRLDELSSIHAPQYSDGNTFTNKDCSTILKDKFIRRFAHPLFLEFSKIKIDEAFTTCCRILEESNFSSPTLLHMDVKPANIIYSPNTKDVALIDFEFARFGDVDYGWTQILLSRINAFSGRYRETIVPYLISGRLHLEEALLLPKFRCYIFYQLACNLIYYYDRKMNCPKAMEVLFNSLLNELSEGK